MCGNLTSSLFPLQHTIFTETVDRARHHIRLGVGHIYIFSNRIHSDAVWMFYGRIRAILDEISVEHFHRSHVYLGIRHPILPRNVAPFRAYNICHIIVNPHVGNRNLQILHNSLAPWIDHKKVRV